MRYLQKESCLKLHLENNILHLLTQVPAEEIALPVQVEQVVEPLLTTQVPQSLIAAAHALKRIKLIIILHSCLLLITIYSRSSKFLHFHVSIWILCDL